MRRQPYWLAAGKLLWRYAPLGELKDICMALTVLGVAIARAPGKRSGRYPDRREVVEMGVRYADGLQVAVVQSRPNPQSIASATVPIASTSTASYSPKIKVGVMGSKPSASPRALALADHSLSGAVKTFTPTRARRDRRSHARGLLQSICAVHMVLLSM